MQENLEKAEEAISKELEAARAARAQMKEECDHLDVEARHGRDGVNPTKSRWFWTVPSGQGIHGDGFEDQFDVGIHLHQATASTRALTASNQADSSTVW